MGFVVLLLLSDVVLRDDLAEEFFLLKDFEASSLTLKSSPFLGYYSFYVKRTRAA